MGRSLANRTLRSIGFGCMSLSQSYGPTPDRDQSIRLLNQALDMGYNHYDTATIYGAGHNESLIAEAIGHRRQEFFLASKAGLYRGAEGRIIDGHPDRLQKSVDESLQRLGMDHIDLYYLHRLDPNIAIEESVGALGEMVKAGKIGSIGLSEVSATTLRRAHSEHAISAVQNEYSLWSRNVELGILQATRELGIALVAFSPVGRGWLAGAFRSTDDVRPHDLRRNMPRFTAENLAANRHLLDMLQSIATDRGITLAQLSLAWVLGQADHIHTIPGTASIDHMVENIRTPIGPLPRPTLEALSAAFAHPNVAGTRYTAAMQRDVDTEEFA